MNLTGISINFENFLSLWKYFSRFRQNFNKWNDWIGSKNVPDNQNFSFCYNALLQYCRRSLSIYFSMKRTSKPRENNSSCIWVNCRKTIIFILLRWQLANKEFNWRQDDQDQLLCVPEFRNITKNMRQPQSFKKKKEKSYPRKILITSEWH